MMAPSGYAPRRSLVGGWLLSTFAVTMAASDGHADETSMSPTGVDHMLYASPTLEQGMDEIEALLGVRPVRGGRHPQYGTHNALLSLGPGVYLEIIARDPDLPAPDRGPLIDIPANGKSRLITWVYRTAHIRESAAAARDAGIGVGGVSSGRRTKPEGGEISWQLTDPYAMPVDGAIPFLIYWGNTPHPSGVAPPGGELVEFVIEHPDAERVRDALSILGSGIDVEHGDTFRIIARIRTKKGLVTLQ